MMRSSLASLLIGLIAVVRAAPFDRREDLTMEGQENLHSGSHNGTASSIIHLMFDWSKQHGLVNRKVPQGVRDRLKNYFRTMKPPHALPLPVAEYRLSFDHSGDVWSYDNDFEAFDFYWWAEAHKFEWTHAHLPKLKRGRQIEGSGLGRQGTPEDS
ncbi:hypothetical protein F5876DRAFT_67492 [Lentinula aff. lateritia]|uniref:Uncharacterized protein n=1 Tax=Lentinula aff. lateritia TaxID=2804960 RepID=A0ACC1TTS9_9AGAR|nr:hypothetical protein F5876DRAFT_67492 [Lentinula aff. lateritia]